jgi:glutamate-1-semialdehyde 2,1-aminomutase
VVVIPFNDPARAIALLDEHKDELACVLLDLMPHRVGLCPATPEFVAAIRDWTKANDALLVLDEVITFRSEYGGAQEWYGMHADLTAMAKLIGGGFPAGAIAGRRDVMNVMNPLAEHVLFPHSGTFSANPITMTAGLAAMHMFDRPAVARINALAKRAMDGIEDAIARTGITACVTGGGSMFRVHLKAKPPQNYRESFNTPEESKRLKLLLDHLFESGCMLINTCAATISTPMGEAEVDTLVAAMESGFRKLVAAS